MKKLSKEFHQNFVDVKNLSQMTSNKSTKSKTTCTQNCQARLGGAYIYDLGHNGSDKNLKFGPMECV